MTRTLKLKLCRFGRKRKPFYRIGVLQTFRHPGKKFATEYVGWYNPLTKEINVNKEALQKYLDNNIAMTDTVRALLKKHSYIS